MKRIAFRNGGTIFRPAFLALGTAINALDRPVVLALTATATEPVIKDIAKQLDIPDMRVINTGIYRPNLHYRVIQVTNEEEKHLEAFVACSRRLDTASFMRQPSRRWTNYIKRCARRENRSRSITGNLGARNAHAIKRTSCKAIAG